MYMQGDVQMSVSVLLVLGDKTPGLVNEIQQEQWFSSYIGMYIHTCACMCNSNINVHRTCADLCVLKSDL